MLVKTNKKSKDGKDLYFNKLTGVECILRDHIAQPSMRRQIRRRQIRHMNEKPRTNNRKSHGEVFVQQIQIKKKLSKGFYELTNKVKPILHYTYGAIARKSAQMKMMHGIA